MKARKVTIHSDAMHVSEPMAQRIADCMRKGISAVRVGRAFDVTPIVALEFYVRDGFGRKVPARAETQDLTPYEHRVRKESA